MKNYSEFKEIVIRDFVDYLPEEYEDFKVNVGTVIKVNSIMDSISLIPMSESGHSGSPVIYIDNMYKDYKQCKDLNQVLKESAETMVKGFKEFKNVSSELDHKKMRENIVMVLVNTERNVELLKTVPNRQFHDLSIIYRWVVDTDRSGMTSAFITNYLAKELDIKEEELYLLAFRNTLRLFPPTVKPLHEVLEMFINEGGVPLEIQDKLPIEKTEIYFISNTRGMYGAIYMACNEVIYRLAEKLDSNLYILPSSTHEVMALSTSGVDENYLAQSVKEINMNIVDPQEQLSNQVYYYDRILRKLSIVHQ
jgi:hypothetical protein